MASDIANSGIPVHPLEDYAWRSNYTLLESSQAEFRGLLEGLHNVLSEHDVKIARTQATLDQLLDERKSYVLRIDKLKSALAPHKKLPPELLSKIFRECSPAPLELPPDNIRDIYNEPSVATSSSAQLPSIKHSPRAPGLFPPLPVCSRWREIALNTRGLWDDVSITYPDHSRLHSVPKTGYHDITKGAQKIISRGTRSIAISIRLNRNVILPAAVDPMRNIIVPFSHQLTHINLTSSMPHIFDFLRSSSPSYPVLESLSLVGMGGGKPYEHESESVSELVMFKNTPNLKILKMGVFDKLSLSRIQLPWDQLTTIDFQYTRLDARTADWLLSQCTCAVSCWFSLYITLEDTHTPLLTTIVQPRLQSLSVTSGDSNSLALFLHHLTLPSLCSFEIADPRVEDSFPEFLYLFSRSHCTLVNFSMPYAQIPALLLDPFLELLPALENLAIPRVIIPIPTLERIAQGVLLPKLTSIACTIQSSPHSLESFMDAVEQTGAKELGVTRLRIASTMFPPTERHYTAARWPQVIQRFENLAEKLCEEGRCISFPEFRSLSFGSSLM